MLEKQSVKRSKVVFVFGYNFIARRAGSYNRARQMLNILRRYELDIAVYSKRGDGRRFYSVASRTWTSEDVAQFHKEFPDCALVLDQETIVSWCLRKIKNLLITLLPGHARLILDASVPFVDRGWMKLKRRGADLLVLNYTHSLPELNGLFGDRRVVDQHDIEFVLNQRTASKFLYDHAVLLKARRELAMLETITMVIAISFSEKVVDQMLLRGPEVAYLPNLSDARPIASFQSPRTFDLMFVGGNSHFNRVGLSEFLTEALAKQLNLRIAIVGSVCDDSEVRSLAMKTDRFVLLGYIDDLSSVYSMSKATICPVGGAGNKTKLLESLQHGRPVFASERALEGLLPGYESCVFKLDIDILASTLAEKADVQKECREYVMRYEAAISDNAFVRLLNFFERNDRVLGAGSRETNVGRVASVL